MATQTIRFAAEPGLILTVDLFGDESQMLQASAPAVETPIPTVYDALFEDLPAGDYVLVARTESGDIAASWEVSTQSITGVYVAREFGTDGSNVLAPQQPIVSPGVDGATIKLPSGLTSTTPTIAGTDVSYDRLLSPTIEPGDVTVTIGGETTDAVNSPIVDADGGVTLELAEAEAVDGALVTFNDPDNEWLRVDVTLLVSSAPASIDSALTQSISDRLDQLTDRLIHAHVNMLGPPIVGDTLRLVRNKDYTASNDNLISIPLPAVAGRDTADEALLTVTDCQTEVPVLLRAQGTTANDIAVWAVSGDQLGFPAGAKYKFMVELRHSDQYQAVLIGKAVLLQDIAVG